MFSNLLPVSIGITDPQSISWEAAVALPERTKIDDWISYNLQDFFFEVISFFSVIQFYCTNEHCPIMKGHDEYKWKDRDTKSKISLPAPKYIALAFEWLHMEFESENHFPSISINKYSENFQTVIAPQVAKELARIYSHIVCFHNEHFSKDSPDKGRLGISLHHFYHFVKLYNLISKSTWGQLQNSLEISGEANSLKVGQKIEGEHSEDSNFHQGEILEIKQGPKKEDTQFLVFFHNLGKQEWLPRHKIVQKDDLQTK